MYSEVGFDLNCLKFSNEKTTNTLNSQVTQKKFNEFTLFNPGIYLGIRYSIHSKISLNLGLSGYLIDLGYFEKNKTNNSLYYKEFKFFKFSEPTIPNMYLRIIYKF